MALMKTRRGEDPKIKKVDGNIKVSGDAVEFTKISDEAKRNKEARQFERDMYDKNIASGDYVPLSSIKESSPESYKLWSSALKNQGKAFGLIGDYAIPKTKANAKNYRDIYDSNFNPDEYRKASESGKLESYTGEINSSLSFGGTKFLKPEEVELNPIPLKKVGKLSVKGGSIVDPTSMADEWSEPSKSIIAPKSVLQSSVGKGSIKSALENTSAVRGVKKVIKNAPYKKEEKEFKAYYGKYSGYSPSDMQEQVSNISQEIKNIKNDKKDYPMLSSERMKLNRSRREEKSKLRTATLAERFASKNLMAISSQDNTGSEKISVVSKPEPENRFYKPDMGESYTAYSKKMSYGRKNK